jgi:hypothetical protein
MVSENIAYGSGIIDAAIVKFNRKDPKLILDILMRTDIEF